MNKNLVRKCTKQMPNRHKVCCRARVYHDSRFLITKQLFFNRKKVRFKPGVELIMSSYFVSHGRGDRKYGDIYTYIYLAGFFKRLSTAISTVSLVPPPPPTPHPPNFPVSSSYKTRNCLNIRTILDILDNRPDI